ncbi:MAG: lipase maturation factor family protein [Terriglobales bacterium]
MDWRPASVAKWLFDSQSGPPGRLIPRWIVLRALGLIYFSAFFSLIFQIRGLIGPDGILPAGQYLQAVAAQLGAARFWFAPTLLWFSSGSHMLMALCWIGLLASLLVVANVWPRATLAICFVCFLSFVSAAGDFSGYQSDGMLLEAGFISLFFAPPGLRPGWATASPASRASWFLLQWEWLRIYFESGVAKIASGDPEWRHFTAMDNYYQNGPLPTWIGWYVQHLPHWFHASSVYATLALELGLVWMFLLPRRFRIILFFIVTPWEIGVILTANYCFLNYLVLALGFLLLDDRFFAWWLPAKWKARISLRFPESAASHTEAAAEENSDSNREMSPLNALRLSLTTVVLSWIFYATTAPLIWMFMPQFPLPTAPVTALDPFRIANRYGLFAVMTRARYEIEFQGSEDGKNWVAYPFRFKPQDIYKPPGIYAPYQPRFDWNLWFASLGSWREYPIVPSTEERLLANDPDVLALFAGNPFAKQAPKQVRAVLFQYWFTTMAEKRETGAWWRREYLGLYAPTLGHDANGKIEVEEWPAGRE